MDSITNLMWGMFVILAVVVGIIGLGVFLWQRFLRQNQERGYSLALVAQTGMRRGHR